METVLRSHAPSVIDDISAGLQLPPPGNGAGSVSGLSVKKAEGNREEDQTVPWGGVGVEGGALFIHGPPGVGKTRLVRNNPKRAVRAILAQQHFFWAWYWYAADGKFPAGPITPSLSPCAICRLKPLPDVCSAGLSRFLREGSPPRRGWKLTGDERALHVELSRRSAGRSTACCISIVDGGGGSGDGGGGGGGSGGGGEGDGCGVGVVGDSGVSVGVGVGVGVDSEGGG